MRSIAWVFAVAMALLFAPVAATAQTAAAPEQYNNSDQFGVDLVTGSYNFSLVEGSIGPANAGISLVRLWTRAGWQDNWSGDLRRTVEGSTDVITITFGGRSERFTLAGSAWVAASGNGATLTVVTADREWHYRAADGTLVTYKSPLLLFDPSGEFSEGYDNSIDMPSVYCTSSNALACGVPTQIQRPDDNVITLTWDTPENCTIFDPIPINPPYGTCPVTYRLLDVRSATGFALKITYATNASSPSGTPTGWFQRTGAKFYNLAAVSCAPAAYDCSGVSGTWPTVTYAYPSGALEVTNSVDGTWRIDLSTGRVTGIRRPGASSDTTSISYTDDRVTSITADGATRSYAWTAPGGNVQVVATDSGAGGGTTTVVTDPHVGRPTSVTNATSNAVSYIYDGDNRITRVTQPEGNYVNYTRDARGNVTETRMVDKTGVSSSSDIVTTANFDTVCSNTLTCNQPNYVVDALNNRTDYTYSSTHGGVTRIQMPAPVTNGTRPEINYTYTALQPEQLVDGNLEPVGDPVWKVTEVTSCATAATCSGTANETRVTITYGTPNLLPTSVTTASGDGAISLTTAYSYDTRDNLVSIDGPLSGTADTTTFIIDDFDRRRGVIGPDPDGSGSRVRVAERYSFDAANRIIKVERGNVTATTAAALDAMTALQTLDVTYDANGNRVRETASSLVGSSNVAFNVIQYGYDAQQRPACTALRMNPATWASLPTDACTAATAGSDGPDRITRNTYDGNDRVTLVETGVGSSIASTEVATQYTANGRLDYVRDGENNRTTYTYDGYDRLRQTQYPSTTQGANSSNTSDYEQLSYDKNSRVTLRRLRDGTSIGLGYDNLGRLTSRDMPGSETDATYSYDLSGRMLTAVQGGTTSFSYDALGRTVSTTNAQGTVDYGYDAAGRRNRLDYIDSFYVTYDHDVLGNVTAIRENGATSGVGVLASYAYDNLGRRESVTYGNGTSQSLTFDNADRLVTLANNLSGSSDDLSIDFTYNPASQIASQTRSDDSYAWTPTATDTTDTINGLNQIMENGLTSVIYDARGNLTNHGSATYSYSADNQLLTAPNGGGATWDALGRLNRYTANGMTTVRFNYDGIDAIAEVSNGVIARRYVHGPGTDDPIVWYEGSGTSDRRFLHSDERGSIVSVTDSSGALIGFNRYDPYGVPASTNIGRFQYTGQQWLGEIGLYHYKARMYAPSLGRFMQTDPIGYADGMNWYAYVGGDPINFVDPLGMKKCKDGSNDICVTGPWRPKKITVLSDLLRRRTPPCDLACQSINWLNEVSSNYWGRQLTPDPVSYTEDNDATRRLSDCMVNFLRSLDSRTNWRNVTLVEGWPWGGRRASTRFSEITYLDRDDFDDLDLLFHELGHVPDWRSGSLNEISYLAEEARVKAAGGRSWFDNRFEIRADAFASRAITRYNQLDRPCDSQLFR